MKKRDTPFCGVYAIFVGIVFIPPYKIFLLNFKINKISEAKSFCIHIGFTREIFLRCFIKMMILKINHDLVFEIITWSNKKCYKSHLTKFFCIKNIQYYKKKWIMSKRQNMIIIWKRPDRNPIPSPMVDEAVEVPTHPSVIFTDFHKMKFKLYKYRIIFCAFFVSF